MSLIVRKTNITTAFADAIVNAENTPNGYGGSIVAAGGPELAKELERIGPCAAGEVKLTGSYDIPGAYKIQYIIHTTAPPLDAKNADKLIARCYRKSLELASELGLKNIAFPLISGGDSGFTKARALEIARREIAAFLSAGIWPCIWSATNAPTAKTVQLPDGVSSPLLTTAKFSTNSLANIRSGSIEKKSYAA